MSARIRFELKLIAVMTAIWAAAAWALGLDVGTNALVGFFAAITGIGIARFQERGRT